MARPALAHTPAPARLRCYLVEDHAMLRRELIAALEEMLPLQVVGSADGESGACRWLAENGADVDLVIVDLMLKQGSGFGVLSVVHAQAAETRLVVLSNFVNADVRQQCHHLGARRVFDKSTELDELVQYIERVASERRPRLQ